MRGLSQEKLAAQAQVTARALRYWEADRQQPRMVELENVLKALEATLQERGQVLEWLSDARSVRLAQSAEAVHDIPRDVLGPLPGIGDLIRAMRCRSGWTQERFAEEMRVNRATVIRWEATRTIPSIEDVERLCVLCCASPEERGVLRAKRLFLSSWSPELTLEECLEQYELIRQVRSGSFWLLPLQDLQILTLKRRLRLLLSQSSEALRLLAKVESQHSWWLYMQGRKAEAWAGNWRTLKIVCGKFQPDGFWLNALNLLSSQASGGMRTPENSLQLLKPWLQLMPNHLQSYLLCDMALYAGRAQRFEESFSFLKRAEQARLGRATEEEGEEYHFQMTHARILLSGGKPIEALSRFPPISSLGDGHIHELLVWAETYLAAGDKNMASHHLCEAQRILSLAPMPARQSKLEQLTRRL